MLKIQPSLRKKKRYLYFKVHSTGKIPYENLRNAIWNGLIDFLGELGTARANVRVLKNLWKPAEQTGIIRCSNRYVNEVKVALSLIHQIGDNSVVFQVTRVSGSIEGATR